MQIQKTDFGGKLTIDYFSAEDLRKVLDMIHKGENATGETEGNILMKVSEATPLEPAPTESPVAGVVTAAPEAAPAAEEEVFTRHDTLEVPETPAEELDSDEGDLYSLKNFSL